ncbi:secretogranin-2 [Megalops cyprinoides]|uniref:secretogranin-2 n=1 Tax=Megalops cyprinoides TaxID=118141 RepID=UPI00186436D6|nr:secretogranin-2 [Megalops cyprinoides]
MLSLLKLSVAGALFLLTTLLHTCGVQSASLRPHKLRGGETEARQPGPYFVPSTDMVKALEYIESLQQQADGADEDAVPDYDDDIDRFRSLLRLAPVQNQEEATDRKKAAGRKDDKSQQWLKAVLRTLQQAGKEPKTAGTQTNARHSHGNRKEPDDGADDSQTGEAGDYEGYPFPEHSKPRKKYPLMFEDEDSRESPYKRTNENVEEQYTPQSLATLQSVFEELGKLSAAKGHKRQSLDEDEKFYRDDDDDIYRLNNLAYEDVTGGEEWTPVEEKVETEEEVKDSREEFDRGSDENEEEDDMKRSSQPAKYREKEDPDDVTKLVDYYLLKILEKSEQTEQKRDRAEEEKRSARTSFEVDPQAIYQLIDISQKLQIPPEDLIEMLKSGEIKKQDKMLQPDEETDDLDRVEEKLTQISSYNKNKSPAAKFYNRRLPEMLANDIPDDLNTEDILNILGLESLGNQKPKYLQKQRQIKTTPARYYVPSGRRGNYILSEPGVSNKREADYDDTVDEDELAAYLAAKMLAQYPKVINKVDNKRTSQPSPKEEQLALGTFEQAMQDYFNQLATDKGSSAKRLSETDDLGGSPQTQSLDDETLLKMLEYLNPETGENEGRDVYGKTKIGGM